MKKINLIYLALFLIGLVSFSSCAEMEYPPSDRYTDDNYWTSLTKAQWLVNQAYNQLYSAGKMIEDERLGDNLYVDRGINLNEQIIRNGFATPALGLFRSEWNRLYKGIKTCHIFLEKSPLVELKSANEEKEMARMRAEMRYIRADHFFRLTNLYGDVPFFTEDISQAAAKTVSRSSSETVIAFIHQELDEIMEILPSKNELQTAEKGKITRGTACMLQARVYLYKNDWANVEKYTRRLIEEQGKYGQYSLFPTYDGLFLPRNEYNDEIIMDYAYVPTLKTWDNTRDMAPMSVGARETSTAPLQSLADSYITLKGLSISKDPDYDEDNPYLNRDPRMSHTIVYDNYLWYELTGWGQEGTIIKIRPGSGTVDECDPTGGKNNTPTGYYTRKWYDNEQGPNFASGLNIITMRYADVLLMYAEAMMEQGKMTEDIWDKTIRPIRQRAGFTAETALNFPTDGNQANLREIIRNERRSELALEGLRWWDIKRWKKGKEYLDGWVYGAKFVNGGRDYIRLSEWKFDEGRDYLWAVPQQEIDMNQNLKPNNPNYSN